MEKTVEVLKSATIRFAGDSGDGMQIAGSRFTDTSAQFGNDLNTFPDYPAEIRAPAGTLFGVSGFQIQFASRDVFTPGDEPDVLIVMNPAALKVNLKDLKPSGTIIANEDAFNEKNLQLAGYSSNPLEDGTLTAYKLLKVPITRATNNAVKELGLTAKDANRCKNFYALGLTYWLYDRPLEVTIQWLEEKFSKKPVIAQANINALKAGYYFGETAEIFTTRYKVKPANLPKGIYKNITGNNATALGILAASLKSGLPLFLGSYPITPASEILQDLSSYKNFGVKTFQAEDEIAAICAAIGASFGGSLAFTSTSGPGMALKSEAIGLAVMTELPLVIADIQRGGPSTGLPTKTEQADLFQAIMGRNGECPVPVVAASSPADCFMMIFEAARIACKFMTPVIFLSDGYIANGAEPWRIPHESELPKIEGDFWTKTDGFQPYMRDEFLARPWVKPGTPGLEHRIGGLEKQHITGNVSYDTANHEFMVKLRAEKVKNIENHIPLAEVEGDKEGELLIIGWGSTYGSITTARERLLEKGYNVSRLHLKYLNPFPKNLGEVMSKFNKVLVPELNLGQLRKILRAEYLVDAIGLNKVQGRPFKASEIEKKVIELLENKNN
ncbi:MAG: 2-oxoglutarate ferredoxin oxidoreductase subunit alpha [Chlorobi bacterium OLB5]|nr:MAG: 2-oxoglutarate ferredoxin oxidoreductase subunit alpha [Chlorobi bacterium OLB5]